MGQPRFTPAVFHDVEGRTVYPIRWCFPDSGFGTGQGFSGVLNMNRGSIWAGQKNASGVWMLPVSSRRPMSV